MDPIARGLAGAPEPALALRPAAFLDRDGVLIADTGFVSRPADAIWTPGAAAALRRLNAAGFRVFVVTNQSGVARGLFGPEAVEALHRWMSDVLGAEGARIDDWRFAPFHADAMDARWRHPDHPWRKPNPGMLLDLMKAWPTDRNGSWMIGDRTSDVAAGEAAGVRGRLFPGGDLDGFVADLLGGDA